MVLLRHAAADAAVMSDDLGLALFGERAPSALGSRPPSSLDSRPETPQWKVQKPSQKYSDRIFGKSQRGGGDSARSDASFNQSRGRRSPTPKHRGKSSFVDETLFGVTRTLEHDFDDKTVWESSKKLEHKPVIKDPSKTKKIRNSRPGTPASRPGSAMGKRSVYKRTSENSFVDDTLFGKGDASASIYSQQNDSVQYDYFGNRIMTKAASKQNAAVSAVVRPPSRGGGSVTPDFGIMGTGFSSSRPSSAASSSRPASAMSTTADRKISFESWVKQAKSDQRKVLPSKYQVFSSSYVDESLFGPKPAQPDFAAPWGEPDKGKPFIFDSSNYATKVSGNTGSTVPVIREKGPYLRKPVVKNPDAKPAWK